MKILLVLTYYRPHWTGLTQYAARLAEGLIKSGDKVEVLCSQHRKDLPKQETVNGVKVFRVPYQFRFLRSVVMTGFPFKLFQGIKRNDIILVFLPLQEVILVTLICKILKKKLFLVHNGDLVLPEKGGLFNRLIEKIYFWSTSFGIKNSGGIVIHTKDYAEHSKHLVRYKNKWRVILPPFIVPEVTSGQVKKFKEKYHLFGNRLIGFSGRFVEEKGVDYLLRVIPLVIKKVPDAHFIFAGEHKVTYEKFWETVEPLIRKYQKYISLLGLLDQNEIYVFYKSLAVLVIPSRTDCFPFAQVEATFLGTPVVCTNIPGARWVVEQTGMGLLVEPRKPDALAEGIVKVLKRTREYQGLLSRVKEVFNYEESLSKYKKLFKE